MRHPLTVTAKEARRFMLTHLLLTGAGAGNTGSAADTDCADNVIRVFERIKCLQYDPLSIAGRNHDIALQSRVKNYKPAVCEGLLYGSRRLLDSWDRKMGIILTADWPGFRRFHMQARLRHGGTESAIYPILDKVREYIDKHGPTTAKEININGDADWWFDGIGNWGSPNIGRVALESMLLWGELVIAYKKNGRKTYDFAKKLIPEELYNQPDPHPSEESYAEWRVLRRVASAGLIWKGQSTAWMTSAVLTPRSRNAAIERLIQDGRLLQVCVEGVKQPFLARYQDWAQYNEYVKYEHDGRLRFIAPQDNLMWDRRLIKALFNMDYHWEVYEPPHKRKFGYYVLPVLFGDELIGRIEPVFKKGDSAMRVKGLWWEDGAKTRKPGAYAIRQALEAYAHFLGADDYILDAEVKNNI